LTCTKVPTTQVQEEPCENKMCQIHYGTNNKIKLQSRFCFEVLCALCRVESSVNAPAARTCVRRPSLASPRSSYIGIACWPSPACFTPRPWIDSQARVSLRVRGSTAKRVFHSVSAGRQPSACFTPRPRVDSQARDSLRVPASPPACTRVSTAVSTSRNHR